MRESCKAISAPRDGPQGRCQTRHQHPSGLQGYGISETFYRYQAKLKSENAVIADWLLKLTQTH